MIFIYNDYGGTHTTSLAAALHLKIISPSSFPLTKEEILAVPYFNKLTKKDFGKLIFHGKDQDGHLVYTIGRKSQKLVVPSLESLGLMFFEHFNIEERLVFSNTSPTVPTIMSFGGFFSRGLGMDAIGVPLLVQGAKKCLNNIYELVETTKQAALISTEDQIVVLDNKQFQK
ncbi:DUF3189 family protein [Cytobacillus solani]|uniref:DUF3189 family protein n=1 Tax=Cytobacillus solani TaxID=1637975 RepID=UPI0006AB7D45|nr:DUF3189 family protein [Cytobacillus solani]KOP81856.1 ABC transporter [Bacillus sp. FJAT-21945]USK56783.1 DUF3189 family protein [Cytobacillus solani]